jgi:hypothetical protein
VLNGAGCARHRSAESSPLPRRNEAPRVLIVSTGQHKEGQQMSKQTPAAVALTVLALACGPTATAGEHALEFKLVTKPLEVKSLEAPNVDGQVVLLMKMHGVAFFKDGRVASKEFIFNADFNKGSGPFLGYSTYQFEDGSSITARFAGTARAGQLVHGEYTVLSGTGAYAGAKGTGSFDGIAHKLTGANLLNGKFAITTP